MELKNCQDALVDKICLYNFSIPEIDDLDKLKKMGIVSVLEDQQRYLTLKSGEYFSMMKIEKTEFFDDMIYTVGKYEVYGRLEMSVTDDGYHNLNCFTIDQYKEKIFDTMFFLKEQYGITVDFEYLKIKSIEINKTIVLERPFEEYQNAITLLMYLLPGNLRLRENDYYDSDGHDRNVETYRRTIDTYLKSSGKNGITVKIYDKTKQLFERFEIIVCFQYLRYEITLKSQQSVCRALETNIIWDLSDKEINNYFMRFQEKNVNRVYLKHCQKRDVKLRQILKEYYVPKSKTWTREVMVRIREGMLHANVLYMLDIEDLVEQVGCLRNITIQQRYEIKKRFRQLNEKQNSVFCEKNNEKIFELLNKLKI